MKKRWWRKPQEIDTDMEHSARNLTDADILEYVRQSLEAEARQEPRTQDKQFLRQVKESIALEGYLAGESSLEDVRAYFKCEQCAGILEFSRKRLGRLLSSTGDKDLRPGLLVTELPSSSPSAGQSAWLQIKSYWKPLAMALAAGLIILPVLLAVLPWISPNASAILRFGEAPKPIAKEHGLLGEKVSAFLAQAEQTAYVAPSAEALQAMQEAAELVTLSLKLDNETLLAEASKAADRAGYGITEFQDDSGLNIILLQEKPGQSRGRGMFLFRRHHYDGQLLIVAPHALWDRHTGQMGFDYFTRIPGADALFLSGTAGQDVDEAHTDNTIFNVVFGAAMRPQAICLSLHGFNENKPGREHYPEVVISSGAVSEPLVQRAHAALSDEISKFMRTGIYDGKRFADVAGTRDQQGIITASVNGVFVHLEFNRAVRFNPISRDHLVTALNGTLGHLTPDIITTYAQPARDTFLQFTTITLTPVELLIEHGHNAVWISSHQMKRLRLRSGDLVLASHDEKHTVARVYSHGRAEDQIYLGGAMCRRLGVQPGQFNVRLSRLPE